MADIFTNIDRQPFPLVKLWIQQIHLRIRKACELANPLGTDV